MQDTDNFSAIELEKTETKVDKYAARRWKELEGEIQSRYNKPTSGFYR